MKVECGKHIVIRIYMYVYIFSWYIWGVTYWNARNGKLKKKMAKQISQNCY
jgi:hypothetical protein